MRQPRFAKRSTPTEAPWNLPNALKLLGLCLLLCSSVVLYAFNIEPGWVEIVEVPLTLPHLPPELHGYRIAQISDVHADRWMQQARLSRIVEQINQQQPDLVAITGDFVTRDPTRFTQSLTSAFRQLQPKDGTVAVLGNHDHWSKPKAIAQALERSNISILTNRVQSLERGNARIYIAGVDDIWAGTPRLDRVLQQLPPKGAAILLVHEPDFADTSAATDRFDLQMSGHSHGGQVRLPFLGAPRLPPYGQKYPSGRYQVGSMIQYTNRGIGMVKPQIRFNCRPEITVFTLLSAG